MKAIKILLGWEMGRGLSHARSQALLGREFQRQGASVKYAFAMLEAGKTAGIDPRDLILSPQWPSPPEQFNQSEALRRSSLDLGQAMARNGFHSQAAVQSVLRQWDEILKIEKPDLVVANYAPGLLLAARNRVATSMVGAGYGVPPKGLTSFPKFHQRTLEPLVGEDELLAMVNLAMTGIGQQPISSFTQTMQADRHLACTYPVLDAFSDQRQEKVAGMLEPVKPKLGVMPGKRVFVYLHANAFDNPQLGPALARLPWRLIVYVPQIPAEIRHLLESRQHTVLDRPADLPFLLPKMRAIIHLGGHDLAALALEAARPQFLLPSHIENWMTASRLKDNGLAQFKPLTSIGEGLSEEIIALVSDEAVQFRCDETARRLRLEYPRSALNEVAEACLAVAN